MRLSDLGIGDHKWHRLDLTVEVLPEGVQILRGILLDGENRLELAELPAQVPFVAADTDKKG